MFNLNIDLQQIKPLEIGDFHDGVFWQPLAKYISLFLLLVIIETTVF